MSSHSQQPLHELYPLIFDAIDQGVFTVDADFVVTSFNAAAERIVGISREEAIGKRCHHIFRASICESGCALRQTLQTGDPLRNVRIDVLNRDMKAVPISVSTAVLRDPEGGLLGGVEIFRDVSELETLRRQLSGKQGFADIIGTSPPMREIFRMLPDVASSDATVLIEGPSGSGKELVANAIHNFSARKEQPFVRINCGALPDDLLESELFGYVKGAFTDAKRDKPGRFLQADGGTILLDEIGDISPAFQVKLLRVLQEGELQPLGGTHTVSVNVRVISATNRDLQRGVSEGTFREDLYYRLRVVPIMLPRLDERREDIPLLVDHFMGVLNARTGKKLHGVTPRAISALLEYSYPGNVRELRNILERAFVLCHDELIHLKHLPPEVVNKPRGNDLTARSATTGDRDQPAQHATSSDRSSEPGIAHLKPSERRIVGNRAPTHPLLEGSPPHVQRLIEALDAHGWNRTQTARALGIARNTLWRRMRDYGLLSGLAKE